jgi:hypothetical protein
MARASSAGTERCSFGRVDEAVDDGCELGCLVFLEEVAGVVDGVWLVVGAGDVRDQRRGSTAGLSDDQLKAYAEKLIAALVHDPDYGP